MSPDRRIRVVLYTKQPFLVRGVAAVLRASADLELTASCDSISGTVERLSSERPDLLLIHMPCGISLAELRAIRAAGGACQTVLWGDVMEREFTFQAMQLGIRSVLPGYTSIEDFLAALRNIHNGVACFESNLLANLLSQKRVALTQRQGQIISLVAQGLKNKQIAFSMGITEGTVKVYLYKLFKKLGVNDRLEMALYARRNLFSSQLGSQDISVLGLPDAGTGDAARRGVLIVARRQPDTSVIH